MPDKYDDQIAKLTADPSRIPRDWMDGKGLFQFCSPSGHNCEPHPAHKCIGCLSMIRQVECYHAWTPELTEAIRNDERIAKNVTSLEQLPVFAEWQRRLDKELQRS